MIQRFQSLSKLVDAPDIHCIAANQQSTRQLLEKIPNSACLYRHRVNDTYYGVKKIAGKRKEHHLQTTERKLAEGKLKGWMADLDKIDGMPQDRTVRLAR